MVGGTVIETLDAPADSTRPARIWINVQDVPRKETCGIYVEATPEARCVSEGDSVWWQGSVAYWCPKQNRLSSDESKRRGHRCGVHYDIKLVRRGYSGAKGPQVAAV